MVVQEFLFVRIDVIHNGDDDDEKRPGIVVVHTPSNLEVITKHG